MQIILKYERQASLELNLQIYLKIFGTDSTKIKSLAIKVDILEKNVAILRRNECLSTRKIFLVHTGFKFSIVY